MAKLVYIGGYGHSGSTLLEYLMTANPQVMACGEVVNFRVGMRTKKCSCGRLAEDCPVWSILLNQTLSKYRHEEVALALLQHASGKHAIVIDSSKTAWRDAAAPFRLRHRLGQNFLLVHIVRDPRAVCWSLLERGRRMNESSYRGLRCITAGVAWLYANLVCELFGWIYPKQYHRIRYEDLARSLQPTLLELLRKVLPAAEWRFERLKTSDNRHQLFGNRMRWSRQLSLSDIREDDAWQTNMPITYRRLVINLCWALCHRYDYR